MQNDYRKLRLSSIAERMRFLSRDVIVYGVAFALSSALSLVTFPIVTRVFSKGDFGIIDALAVVGNVFIPLILCGMDSAIARYFYECTSLEEKKRLISQAAVFQCVLVCGVAGALFFGARGIAVVYLGNGDYTGYVRLVAGIVFCTVIMRFFQNLLKWTFDRVGYFIVTLGSTATVLVGTLIGILVLHQGVVCIFVSQLIGAAVFAVVGLFFCRRYLIVPTAFERISALLHFGLPHMIMAVSAAIIPSYDRYLILHMLGAGVLGVYAVGWKFSLVMNLPVSGFRTAWMPFAFSLCDQGNAERTYNAVLWLYALVASGIACILSVFSVPFVVLLASNKYLASASLVLPVVFSVLLDGFCAITGVGISVSKKTFYYLWAHIASMVVGCAAIVILLWSAGIVGAAYGVLVGKIVLCGVTTAFAMRASDLRFKLFVPVMIVVLAMAAGFLGQRLFLP